MIFLFLAFHTKLQIPSVGLELVGASSKADDFFRIQDYGRKYLVNLKNIFSSLSSNITSFVVIMPS
jgi:hypothetical protein